MTSWLLWALLLALRLRVSQGQDGLQPPVPQGVRVEADFGSQVLSVTWDKDPAFPVLLYEVEVLRTELMEVVHNETVERRADSPGKAHRWSWTSAVPLECTSHSVRLRSLHLRLSSAWSPLQTLPGMDMPDNTNAKMYPQDRVVPVGSNMTFCCVMEEGKMFGRFQYKSSRLPSVRLSRRSYACTVTNQEQSMPSGTNVLCFDDDNGLTTGSGAVVFVGYPPGDKDLECETRDLVSVECQWSIGQDTYLRGSRQTFYSLNGRDCPLASQLANGSKKDKMRCQLSVTLEPGDRNWTITAKNPLGAIQLTDTADLNQRVHPFAPLGVSASETHSRNATLRWRWRVAGYGGLPLECQALVNGGGPARTFDSSGLGLVQAVVLGLEPDRMYATRVRCRLQGALWRWGDWSQDYIFKTQEEPADALDIWAWMDTNQTGYIKWKPLSRSQTHGQILGYEVTYGRPEEGDWQALSLPPTEHSAQLPLGPAGDYVITVTARNAAGDSPPASVTVPKFVAADKALAPSKLLGSDGGFDLSWPADANASCGYVVEWHRTGKPDCDWEKDPAGNTSIRIESASFEAGVRYSFSIYACTSEAPQLLERREGYVKELAPAQHVSQLAVQPYGSGALLSWDEVPLEKRRGFICGYTIYMSNGSRLVPIENITNPDARSHTVTNLQPGSYKFTVKAHTSAGSDGGAIVSLKLDPSTDWLVGEILIALGAMSGFLLLITVFCYTKRQWVKKTFYPEIPEPKLPEEWPTAPGAFGSRTLDVEPCPHSTVHIVQNPEHESGKLEPAVVLEHGPESDDSSGDSSADTDSSGPIVLRYYNQVVDDGSRRPPSTDTSASSASTVVSARTDVTYTGIQSPAAAARPEAPQAGGYRPQLAPASEPAEPEDPQQFAAEPADLPLLGGFGGGYQPQSGWREEDTPESRSLNSSLGSPTSVSSSQFLIPDPATEEGAERTPSTTWFHNLLSGKP